MRYGDVVLSDNMVGSSFGLRDGVVLTLVRELPSPTPQEVGLYQAQVRRLGEGGGGGNGRRATGVLNVRPADPTVGRRGCTRGRRRHRSLCTGPVVGGGGRLRRHVPVPTQRHRHQQPRLRLTGLSGRDGRVGPVGARRSHAGHRTRECQQRVQSRSAGVLGHVRGHHGEQRDGIHPAPGRATRTGRAAPQSACLRCVCRQPSHRARGTRAAVPSWSRRMEWRLCVRLCVRVWRCMVGRCGAESDQRRHSLSR